MCSQPVHTHTHTNTQTKPPPPKDNKRSKRYAVNYWYYAGKRSSYICVPRHRLATHAPLSTTIVLLHVAVKHTYFYNLKLQINYNYRHRRRSHCRCPSQPRCHASYPALHQLQAVQQVHVYWTGLQVPPWVGGCFHRGSRPHGVVAVNTCAPGLPSVEECTGPDHFPHRRRKHRPLDSSFSDSLSC